MTYIFMYLFISLSLSMLDLKNIPHLVHVLVIRPMHDFQEATKDTQTYLLLTADITRGRHRAIPGRRWRWSTSSSLQASLAAAGG